MIAISSPLRALMTSGQYQRADLYTLTLVNGTVLRLTSWQVMLAWGGNAFLPTRIGGDRKWKVSLGLDTDTFSVTIGVDPDNELQINSVPFRQAARAGLLSGGQMQMDWAYLSAGAIVGVLPRFFGTIGQIMPDRLGAKLNVNSPLKILDMQIPQKVYGPHCRWTLGDSDCGVTLADFAVAGHVGMNATQGTIPCSLSNPSGYFNLGIVTFTSGQNQGLKRQVRSYMPGQMILATPTPFAPAANDTFSVTPGCDHNAALSTAGQTITIPPGSPSSVIAANHGNTTARNIPAVIPSATVAPGAQGYADQGVTYASGPHTGQALVRVATITEKTPAGQYAVAGNIYSFSITDSNLSVTVRFTCSTSGATSTCETVFQNGARNGATPFIPPPEQAY